MVPAEFVTGNQWYLDQMPERIERVGRIVIRARIQGRQFNALLDTGASFCVLAWDVAEDLGLDVVQGSPEMRALGGSIHEGVVFDVELMLPADQGEHLTVATSVWTSETFHGPSLIGYCGLLEKIRFAVDPAQNLFYFGA